ncbi:MAG: cadmium-translocating P-type ATPase [Defluviitaleaceae bacterium]|nr:cadmium-translocating P-type ATPase [Defluviitaleaceae bacterium]
MSQSTVTLKLEGLDCANCAYNFKDSICKIASVKNADVSVASNKVSIQYENIDEAELICKIKEKADDLGLEVAGKAKLPQRAFGGLDKGLKIRLLRYAIGGLIYLAALFAMWGVAPFSGLHASYPTWTTPSTWMFALSYIIFGADVLFMAAKSIAKGQVFNEFFLMSVATIAALYIGLHYEAVLVMVLFQVGEFFQDMAVNRSRKSIKDLMDIKAEYANLVRNGEIVQVDPTEVKIGDIILVKPGEKVPLDGVVLEGASQVDALSLTGESVPRSVAVGEDVMSGVINLTSLLRIEVTKDYENSTVAKIMDMVENAAAKKSETERFITKFAKIYTPIVTFTALLLVLVPILFFPDADINDWIFRGIIFLMISCPCALHLSVPLSFFSGIGTSSAKGILFKGSTYLQALTDVGVVVFDKTGTITKGVFKVTQITPNYGITEQELLEVSAQIESYSNHPIAKSIVGEHERRGNTLPSFELTDFEEIHGKGLKAQINGAMVLAGNAKLMDAHNMDFIPDTDGAGSVVYVARDGEFLGHIIISDIIKDDAAEAIKALKAAGIKKTVMLSGDRTPAALAVASAVGIDEVHAELLPDGKVDMVEELYHQYPGTKIAFVGDGINDAPVLSRVDVGIAMGGIGSDAAVEAADVVIMTDEISKLAPAISIARNTMKIVKQNIGFVMAVKIVVLTLALFGQANILWAVVADSGVLFIAALNSIRKK